MVRGLNVFREYFEQYPDNYMIIGGTACDIIIEDAGFTPRATKDIDIILVIEALSTDFVKRFWQFIKDGGYEQREKSNEEKEYYRFMKPQNQSFPSQLELFSRTPDIITLDAEAHLTPIPVNDDFSSLSAILLDDIYYNYIKEHSEIHNNLSLASTEALICLKAKAYLEIKQRIHEGSNEDSRLFKKHKADVFRLAVMLPPEEIFELTESMQLDINEFIKSIEDDLPDNAIFKEMGMGRIETGKVFDQLKKSFKIQ